MLQDRPYMRDSYERPQTSVITWLVSAIVAGFLVQSILLRFFGISFDADLGLSSLALRSGHVWALLTYGFLQDTGNLFQSLLQVIGCLLAIYFIGREILPVVGERRFLWIFLLALAVGGLAHSAMHWRQPELLLGTWPAIIALFIVFACFYPNRDFTLLLFFFLPVNVKPKYVALVLVGIDLFGFIFYEVGHAVSPFGGGLQYSAHLGGAAVGWIYFRYVHNAEWSFGRAGAEIELPRWARNRPGAKAVTTEPAYKVNLGDRSHLRAEVDRILDKINSSGFGSLSAKEKKILDDARDLIGRR